MELSAAEAMAMVLVEYRGKAPGILHGKMILPGERRLVPRWAYEQAKKAGNNLRPVVVAKTPQLLTARGDAQRGAQRAAQGGARGAKSESAKKPLPE